MEVNEEDKQNKIKEKEEEEVEMALIFIPKSEKNLSQKRTKNR